MELRRCKGGQCIVRGPKAYSLGRIVRPPIVKRQAGVYIQGLNAGLGEEMRYNTMLVRHVVIRSLSTLLHDCNSLVFV